MRPAHWLTTDNRIAEQSGDRTHHCPSAGGSRPAATSRNARDDDGGSTIEFGLYLPRIAWHFTFTRKRATPVEFSGIVQTDDDDRDQIAAPSVS
jgi:hypothetical protein